MQQLHYHLTLGKAGLFTSQNSKPFNSLRKVKRIHTLNSFLRLPICITSHWQLLWTHTFKKNSGKVENQKFDFSKWNLTLGLKSKIPTYGGGVSTIIFGELYNGTVSFAKFRQKFCRDRVCKNLKITQNLIVWFFLLYKTLPYYSKAFAQQFLDRCCRNQQLRYENNFILENSIIDWKTNDYGHENCCASNETRQFLSL